MSDEKVILDSKERVAYELMIKIAECENKQNEKDRAYWLTLYRQCYKATKGSELKVILNDTF